MPSGNARWTCLLLLGWVVIEGCNPADSTTPRRTESAFSGTPLSLTDLDGKPFQLSGQRSDRVTVVIFTRTDCPISNRMAPEVCRLVRQYQPRNVAFYLIYVDPNEEPETIRQHLKEYSYPCPGLRDSKHELASQCEATTTPEAVVFGPHPHICYRGRLTNLYVELGKSRAEASTHDLQDAIEATLAGKPVTGPWPQAVGCLIADLKK